jgi:hypothetical protein
MVVVLGKTDAKGDRLIRMGSWNRNRLVQSVTWDMIATVECNGLLSLRIVSVVQVSILMLLLVRTSTCYEVATIVEYEGREPIQAQTETHSVAERYDRWMNVVRSVNHVTDRRSLFHCSHNPNFRNEKNYLFTPISTVKQNLTTNY